MESMAVPTTITRSHAGWQFGIGERHGSMLGTMISAITAEHQIEGYSGMKTAVSAAMSAKKMTITRDGYTPYQRLFGSDIK